MVSQLVDTYVHEHGVITLDLTHGLHVLSISHNQAHSLILMYCVLSTHYSPISVLPTKLRRTQFFSPEVRSYRRATNARFRDPQIDFIKTVKPRRQQNMRYKTKTTHRKKHLLEDGKRACLTRSICSLSSIQLLPSEQLQIVVALHEANL